LREDPFISTYLKGAIMLFEGSNDKTVTVEESCKTTIFENSGKKMRSFIEREELKEVR
jgi:hypothetical protein